MSDIILLNEQELRQHITLNHELVGIIEQAFSLLATKSVIMPPILSFQIPDHHGEVDVKTAFVPGLDGFALKVSTGFFDNAKLGLASLNGLMMLFSAKTGIVQAVMLDNGYLTDIRTAAAGAVAAKYLAREKVNKIGIIGTGLQARLELQALSLVRDFKEVLIWGRSQDKAQIMAEENHLAKGKKMRVATLDELMGESDIIITTTPSQSPLITKDMVKAGQHITAMGSDAPHKAELQPDLIKAADLFCCDRLSQSRTLGELRLAIEQGIISPDQDYQELGQIIAGQKPGRVDDQQITICDLTGTGIQDTAIANFAYQKAKSTQGTKSMDSGKLGFGTIIKKGA